MSQLAALPSTVELKLQNKDLQQSLIAAQLNQQPKAAKPLLLCTTLMQIAAASQSQEDPAQARTLLLNLQQMHDPSTNFSTDIATACDAGREGPFAAQIAMLWTAMLVIKAATLVSSLPQACNLLAVTTQALWDTAVNLILDYCKRAHNLADTMTAAHNSDPQLQAYLDQGRHVAALIVQLIMPVFKQTFRPESPAAAVSSDSMAELCCAMLTGLMTFRQDILLRGLLQAATTELLKQGQQTSVLLFSSESSSLACLAPLCVVSMISQASMALH